MLIGGRHRACPASGVLKCPETPPKSFKTQSLDFVTNTAIHRTTVVVERIAAMTTAVVLGFFASPEPTVSVTGESPADESRTEESPADESRAEESPAEEKDSVKVFLNPAAERPSPKPEDIAKEIFSESV